MRTFLVFASVVTVASLAYVFGPELIEAYHERENFVAEREVIALPEDAKTRDNATFEPKSELTGVSASLAHLRQSVSEPKRPVVKTKAPKPKKQSRATMRRRTASETRDEMSRMGLVPAAQDQAPKVASLEPAARPRVNANPMAGRWVEGLSGPKARLDMGVKANDGSCRDAYSNCERPAAPNTISVTGVVMKTEHLARHPRQPVNGVVKQGHFLDKTPVVYVE